MSDNTEKKGINVYQILIFFFEKMKDEDDPVNPLKYLDESEMYFQSLVIWKETKEELYLPTKNFKPTRHKKVLGTAL